MKYSYLFSRNKKIGSKLIVWSSSLFKNHITNLNKGVPSHVAVLVDKMFVIESVFCGGVRIVPFKKWLEINELLYIIEKDTTGECPKCVLTEVWGKKYDWLGIMYFSYQMIKHLIFKSNLPVNNKWERENYYFCTEFAGRIGGHNYSMTTPAKMCNDLLEGVK